jgi:shikimate dehydrogenase
MPSGQVCSTAPARPPLSGTTTVAGVVGDPVWHSRSPAIHNAAFGHLAMDWIYVAFPVAPAALDEAVHGAHALGVRGLSVTMPHKQRAAELAQWRSAEVERLGSCNTLVLSPEGISAHSTDGAGFLADLRSGLGFEPAGEVCAVLGAGGGARSVVLALALAGAAAVLVVNRDKGRAAVAAALAGTSGAVAVPADLAGASLVVNATPLGMDGAGAGGIPPEILKVLHAGQVLYDLVYHPAETPFVLAGKRVGARARNGLGMLVHQAAEQFHLFTGAVAPLEVMWEAARRA